MILAFFILAVLIAFTWAGLIAVSNRLARLERIAVRQGSI